MNLVYEYLIELIYAIPLGITLLYMLQQLVPATHLESKHAIPMLILLVIVAVLKKIDKRVKWLLAGTILVLMVGVVLFQKPEARMAFVTDYRWTIVIIGIVGISYLIGRFMIINAWVRRSVAALIFAMLVLCMLQSFVLSKLVVAAILFFIMSAIVAEVQANWKKSGDSDEKLHLASLTPFILTGCIILIMIPAPDHPYDWAWVVKLYETIEDTAKQLTSKLAFGPDDYKDGLVGFSEEGRMVGSLADDQDEVLLIDGIKSSGKSIYLAGKTFNHFQNAAWTLDEDEMTNHHDRMLDMLETSCAVRSYDSVYVDNYMRSTDMTIRYQTFRTNYLFMPAKAELKNNQLNTNQINGTQVNDGEFSTIDYIEQGPNLIAYKKQSYGSGYQIHYYRLNTGHEGFQEFLEAEHAVDQKSWDRVIKTYNLMGVKGYTYEDYQNYRTSINELYMSEVELSDELSDYLAEELEGATTDVEKLARMEALLRTYTYTNTPGMIPAKVKSESEFLDYFMLESREGYCVHFATAFALLARSQGIPSRYVQGYYTPYDGEDSIMITSDLAHAWPEVYIDGVGWIPYEPTPGYTNRSAWRMNTREDSLAQSDSYSEDGYYEGYGLKADSSDGQAALGDSEGENGQSEAGSGDESEKEALLHHLSWQFIVIPIVMAIAFFGIYVLIYNIVRRHRFARLSEKERMLVLCKRCMKILDIIGYGIESGETLSEYHTRIWKYVTKPAVDYIECYERMIYAVDVDGDAGAISDSDQAVEETMSERVNKSYELLLEEMKKKTGKSFFWYRYVVTSDSYVVK